MNQHAPRLSVVLVIAVLALRRVSTAKYFCCGVAFVADHHFNNHKLVQAGDSSGPVADRKGKFLGQEIELLEEKTNAAEANESRLSLAPVAKDGRKRNGSFRAIRSESRRSVGTT
jgi:hypothetical protein